MRGTSSIAAPTRATGRATGRASAIAATCPAVRVLITSGALGQVGGMQAYVRDLAAWLLARGHTPVVYGPRHGRTAAQLGRLTVPVTDDLATLGAAPDVIHGNSTVETMTALLHFPATPAIFVCHGWRTEGLGVPHFPRIVHYVAVDDTVADRVIYKEGVPPEKLTVLLNAVDTTRFPPRATPLPPRPKRALVFGNAAHAAGHVAVIEDVCRRADIDVDVVGEFAGNAVDAPEEILGRYDLVFAKAKCALEAMAAGNAVVLCEGTGIGGMVTIENVERLRRLNFGIRTLQTLLTPEAVSEAVAAYDANDAARVSAVIRETASADVLHEQLLALYERAIDDYAHAPCPSHEDESRAAAKFLRDFVEATQPSESNLNLVAQATHRILRAPVVGRALTRVARWIIERGKDGGEL
jgi:hypothetical protein